MLGFECLAVACLLRLLRLAGLPAARVLIYAWNPLAVWCFAGNGHVDAAAIGLIALALMARGLRRDGWAGAALAAATLMKFLPVVLVPAVWRRWDWRFVAAFAVVLAVLYACYIDVGWRVFGFLPAYGSEEGLSGGTGFWLLAGLAMLRPLPNFAGPLYMAAAAIGLVALGARTALRTDWPCAAADDVPAVCGAASVLGSCTMVGPQPALSLVLRLACGAGVPDAPYVHRLVVGRAAAALS